LGRKPAKLKDFISVRERARGLWVRERSDKAWSELQQQLRLDTPVTVFNEQLLTNNDV